MAKVELYTKWTCPYCARAKALLTEKGVDFVDHDISMDSAARDEMRARVPGAMTVPQIFIGDVHVGGCDDLHALDRDGRLDALLAGAG